MSVPGIGYVVHNKARVALERALSNPRKRVMGVDRESKWTFGFSPHGWELARSPEPSTTMKNHWQPMPEPLTLDSYGQFLADLKGRIRAAQLRASMAVN